MTSWLTQVDSTVPRVAVRGCGWGQTLSALCLQFAAEPLLAARKAGYEVFAVIDSSGT
ncbi:MAG: hypothetical protein Q7T78_17770 [Rhodoferax sp.]|nr:hypothetical protein [Rhodoferax sp.]